MAKPINLTALETLFRGARGEGTPIALSTVLSVPGTTCHHRGCDVMSRPAWRWRSSLTVPSGFWRLAAGCAGRHCGESQVCRSTDSRSHGVCLRETPDNDKVMPTRTFRDRTRDGISAFPACESRFNTQAFTIAARRYDPWIEFGFPGPGPVREGRSARYHQ